MAREMKDSGVEWIGQIPKDWEFCKLLYCLRQPICDGPHETPNFVEQGIPFISVDSLNETKNINLNIVKKFISEKDYNNYMTKAKLEKGDILFSKSATIGKTAIVGNEKFMIWSPLAVLKSLPEKCNRNYLYYLLNCRELITAIKLSGTYNTQANVGMRQIEKAKIPLPSLIVQEKIVNYLDEKIVKIDLIIEKTKATIEDYKKYKQSIITETVTKGLNPDVEMKDSGIEWIGQIPKHWKIKKLSQYFSQVKNKNSDLLERNLLSLSYGKIIRKDINKTDGLLPENFSGYNIIEKGDIVLRLTDLQNDHKSLRVGLCKEKGIITSAYITLRNKNNQETDYFYNYIHTFDIHKGFYGMGDGVRQGLTFEGLKKFKIVVPPLEEQKEIAEYLDKKVAEIDNLIAKKESLINEMEEYKKSLIYECVTGKKEIV